MPRMPRFLESARIEGFGNGDINSKWKYDNRQAKELEEKGEINEFDENIEYYRKNPEEFNYDVNEFDENIEYFTKQPDDSVSEKFEDYDGMIKENVQSMEIEKEGIAHNNFVKNDPDIKSVGEFSAEEMKQVYWNYYETAKREHPEWGIPDVPENATVAELNAACGCKNSCDMACLAYSDYRNQYASVSAEMVYKMTDSVHEQWKIDNFEKKFAASGRNPGQFVPTELLSNTEFNKDLPAIQAALRAKQYDMPDISEIHDVKYRIFEHDIEYIVNKSAKENRDPQEILAEYIEKKMPQGIEPINKPYIPMIEYITRNILDATDSSALISGRHDGEYSEAINFINESFNRASGMKEIQDILQGRPINIKIDGKDFQIKDPEKFCKENNIYCANRQDYVKAINEKAHDIYKATSLIAKDEISKHEQSAPVHDDER